MPGDSGYEKWLDLYAYFSFCPMLVEVAAAQNCTIVRWNPMRNHDPKKHRNAVVGKADKFGFASDWLKAMLARKKDFPFIVNIT